MTRHVLLLSAVCVVSWLLLGSQPVSACSPYLCTPDQFLPRAGSVPANLRALAWWPGHGTSGSTSATDLRLVCDDGAGNTRALALALDPQHSPAALRLETELRAGDSCSVSAGVDECDLTRYAGISVNPIADSSFLAGRAQFRVEDAAPLPAALGTLVTAPAVRLSIELSEGAACSRAIGACVIEATLAFTAEAVRWKDAFVYETTVDGKPWRIRRSAPLPVEEGGSYAGRGRELFFFAESDDMQGVDSRGLDRGRHTVTIRARLPGTGLVLSTEPVEIDLACDPRTPGMGADRAGNGAGSSGDVELEASNAMDPVRAQASSCSAAGAIGTPGKLQHLGWLVLVASVFGRTRSARARPQR